jgi:hypothetical protein
MSNLSIMGLSSPLPINALSVTGCLIQLLIAAILVRAIKFVTDKFILETHVEKVFYRCT